MSSWTKRDQEGCHHGPGGTWLQDQEGSGETRRDIIVGLGGTKRDFIAWDQEGPERIRRDQRWWTRRDIIVWD